MGIPAAPDFELPSLAGNSERLSACLRTRPVVLAFFKVTCPTCQLTFPFLERLHKSSGPETPRMIAISQDDPRATEEFNRRFGVTFTTLLDAKEERYPVSNAYRIVTVPTMLLVEPDGRVSEFADAFDKAMIERLGHRFGIEVFSPDERVPVFRPG
jgi:peroxiredoxin